MAEIQVAFAPKDAAAAEKIMDHLRGLGFRAGPAALKASRLDGASLPQTLVLWSRHAAAEPRLRRAAHAAMVARLDNAPAPRAVLSRLVDIDAMNAAPTAAAKPRPAMPASAASTTPIEAQNEASRKKGGIGGLFALAFGLVLIAGCAAVGAYLAGWIVLP